MSLPFLLCFSSQGHHLWRYLGSNGRKLCCYLQSWLVWNDSELSFKDCEHIEMWRSHHLYKEQHSNWKMSWSNWKVYCIQHHASFFKQLLKRRKWWLTPSKHWSELRNSRTMQRWLSIPWHLVCKLKKTLVCKPLGHSLPLQIMWKDSRDMSCQPSNPRFLIISSQPTRCLLSQALASS